MKQKIISSKIRKEKVFKHICFADIETQIKDGKHEVLCISIVCKDSCHTFLSIDSFMKHVYENCENSLIYFHNFGRFDSLFIMNYLIYDRETKTKINIIERNNIIYEVSILLLDISFRDSLLLIPIPLSDVGETFCDDYKKDSFDYKRMKEIWETSPDLVIKQCENDCYTLQEGFNKFKDHVKDNFGVNLTSQLTLPSLALNIFKKNYYDDKETPINKNPFHEDLFIRRSYKGGISEVYIPNLKDGFCYDANSLYPYAMCNNKFPIGKGRFVNNEKIDLNNFIGFIECEVETDKEINYLTYKHPKLGLMTPIGRWKDVYTHFEVKKAIELGYNIKMIRGYKYEKEENIFKEFVNDLYKMRVESTSKALNKITKLILNALYGRFGMKTLVESTKFIKEEEVEDMKKKYNIGRVEFLGNGYYSITTIKRADTDSTLYAISADTETAVHIASFITAYARTYMYTFKNIPNNKCYYTDTDSVFLEKELEEKYIGKELGDFKLEYKVKEGIFISPKVYYIEKGDSSTKITVKGIKKNEFSTEDLLSQFRKIISGGFSNIVIKRINLFKRDLLKLLITSDETNISPNFPLSKRNKVFDKDGKWINTSAKYIKEA